MVYPCATAKLRVRILLGDEQDLYWGKTCAGHVDDEEFLNQKITDALLACPCNACIAGRNGLGAEEVNISPEKINKAKRLLATCIIAERPWLIYAFLRPGVDIDDEKFDGWVSKTDLAA